MSSDAGNTFEGLDQPAIRTISIEAAHQPDGRGEVSVPDDLLLSADFARSGSDLFLIAPGGETAVVPHFFAQEALPDLVSVSGARMDGDWVGRLAGPQAPAQYAQNAEVATDAPIGTIESLTGSVTATHADGSQIVLQKGDAIFQGDLLETGADGSVGVLLADETTFSLGESGSIVMDELIYDPALETGAATINLVKGVFTFVSGQISKTGTEAMVVKTPVATIGIRGTSGGIEVEPPAPGGPAPGQPGAPEPSMTVVLTPDPDGSVGEMAISNGGGTQVLNQPFQGTSVASFNAAPQAPFSVDPATYSQNFGSALRSLPPSPSQRQQNQDDQPQEGEEQQAEGEGEGEGEPQEGEGEGDPEGEGEPQEGEGEGDPEGEGESGEGEPEQAAEGEGEQAEGEQAAEGEGEPQGEEQQVADAGPEGEGEQTQDRAAAPDQEPAEGEQGEGDGQEAAGEPQVLDQDIPQDGEQAGGEQTPNDGPVLDQNIAANDPAGGGNDPTGGGDPIGGNDDPVGGDDNPIGGGDPITGGGGGGLGNGNPITGGTGSNGLAGNGGFDDIIGGGNPNDAFFGSAGDGSLGDLAGQQQNTTQDIIDLANEQQTNDAPPPDDLPPPPPPPEDEESNNNTITGTAGNDTLTGTSGDDVFYGLGGDDIFVNSAGNDTIVDGDGYDYAFLSDGWIPVFVNRVGNDMVVAYQTEDGSQTGSVRIIDQYGGGYGSVGVRALMIEDLDDSPPVETVGIIADAAAYAASGVISGSTDAISAGYTDVIFAGTAGADVVSAATQADENIDIIFAGGAGNDDFIGGLGDDVFVGGTGSNSFDGGAYHASNEGDEVYYEGLGSGVDVDLADGSAMGSFGTDTLANIENVTGTRYDDTIAGDTNANKLYGEQGNDTFKGSAGGDVLDGGDGADTVDYSDVTGNHIIDLAGGTASLNGGASVDMLYNIENAISGSGNDVFFASSASNSFDGGTGTDTINYQMATAGVTASLTIGGATGFGTDQFSNFENLTGSSHNDVLSGDANANTISGGTGDDQINGGAGADVLIGGAGEDTMDGGQGDDVLNGGAGADTLTGGMGSETLIGGDGADIINLSSADTTSDYVVYTTGTSEFDDTVSFFEIGHDKVYLDATNFSFSAGAAVDGVSFKDVANYDGSNGGLGHNNAVVVWDSTNDKLYYDSNGDTAGGYTTEVASITTDSGELTASNIVFT